LIELYLGVDGGGTKCRMRLADANLHPLAEASVEMPSNLQVRNGDAAYEAVNVLTQIVFANAGINGDSNVRVSACFGMAGARMETARDAFEKRDFPFANLKVFDDIDIARAGAHEGRDGAVLIIGTGSAGLAMIDGARHQCGGWGFHIGDTMAGAILGRELLRKSLLAHEGLAQGSALTQAVMLKFGNSNDALMDWSFNCGEVGRPARPADYGEFAPMVFEYYEKGDPIAQDLIAFELAAVDMYVNFFTSRGAKSIAVVGGLGQRLMPLLEDRYGEIIVTPKADPLQGAVILAHQLFAQASSF
jgi:glucosamine kinase